MTPFRYGDRVLIGPHPGTRADGGYVNPLAANRVGYVIDVDSTDGTCLVEVEGRVETLISPLIQWIHFDHLTHVDEEVDQ